MQEDDMNMTITKHKEGYVIEQNGQRLATIETYRNPYHVSNCYINYDSDGIVGIGDANISQIIADEEKSPLQTMVSSLETQKAMFLASQGFTKVRMCHDREVAIQDLVSTFPSQESNISTANRGQGDYQDCCELMFEYYKDTHESINPLSSTFDVFTELMPAEVFYARGDHGIQHVAFVHDNEISYVGSRDEITFDSFAFAVVKELFKENQSIVFEADNVDWAAMALNNLFPTDSTETFDTWIFKK